LQDSPKFIQIGIFGMKIYDLATPVVISHGNFPHVAVVEADAVVESHDRVGGKIAQREDALAAIFQLREIRNERRVENSGLPDFWCNIPKREQIYQCTTKYAK
jgi:hypothetical protein